MIEYNDPVTAMESVSWPGRSRASAEPNPFETSTSIRFQRDDSGPVAVDIYDVQGRRVRTIEQPRLEAGSHTLSWDGRNRGGRRTASGVYFAQVRSRDAALAAKLVRVK